MIKLVFFLLLSVFTAVCCFGQTVSNVDAYQEGKNIIITYDTDKEGSVGGVFCSTDGGRTWGEPLRRVTGDVNKQVPAGCHRIVWDVLSEREKLAGANICFKVEVNSGRFMVNGVSFEWYVWKVALSAWVPHPSRAVTQKVTKSLFTVSR